MCLPCQSEGPGCGADAEREDETLATWLCISDYAAGVKYPGMYFQLVIYYGRRAAELWLARRAEDGRADGRRNGVRPSDTATDTSQSTALRGGRGQPADLCAQRVRTPTIHSETLHLDVDVRDGQLLRSQGAGPLRDGCAARERTSLVMPPTARRVPTG